MDLTALLLSRIQFGSTVAFHIIFPSFTIGLAAWLTVLEACICGPGVRCIGWSSSSGSRSSVSHSGSASSPGSSWRSSSARIGACCRGCRDRSKARFCPTRPSPPFSSKRAFSAILLFGRSRVPPWFYLFSTAMVAFGTTLSAFWIMAQQQLDASADRLCDGERPVRSERLVQDHIEPGGLGAVSAHAPCLLSRRRLLRCRDRRMVPAARDICRRGARHAPNGLVFRRRAGSGPARLRAPQR